MASADTGPVALLGGTFDPVHFGHLRLAEEAADACRLTELRLLPAGLPPHRPAPHASTEHRLAMLALAIAGNPRLRVDARETQRLGPSYTVDTLAQVRAELVPEQPLCLVIGADQFVRLHTWHRWQQLFDLAHLIVATRPGHELDVGGDGALRGEYSRRATSHPDALRESQAGRVLRVNMVALDISASAIRAQLGSGQSPRYLLPDTVLDYIDRHGLYLKEPG